MTDITAKPFDWNDNLSEEAIEDFEGIQKDLPYCSCQNIGMALAKLELLEKQGCKVIDPSGSSSEKPKSENKVLKNIRLDIALKFIPESSDEYGDEAKWLNMGLRTALEVIDKYKAEGSDKE